MINENFTCEHCKQEVSKHPDGSARNHCPSCLYSKHLDDNSPGDRLSNCHGLMTPIGMDFKKNKGNMIKHRCTKCKKEILNKVAPDDNFLDLVKKLSRA
ncbi:MAG: RNHCP domain-containing protein [Candidatus Gracilibacteria bacterium]|nr:RNHCP domain-containing protein [Candidatus Gracilibacteria bacterium]